MSSWARKRAERIREHISIAQFLADYGYPVYPHLEGQQEQQFPCDLHGDGTDNKPSARVYPSSNRWFCFACNKARDAISTIQDRAGVGFSEACRALEKKYGLSPPTWERDKDWRPEEKSDPRGAISSVAPRSQSFEQAQLRLSSLLTTLTREKRLPMRQTLGLWEALDSFAFRVESELWNERKGLNATEKLRERTMQLVEEG
jgi:hypothetical protein